MRCPDCKEEILQDNPSRCPYCGSITGFFKKTDSFHKKSIFEKQKQGDSKVSAKGLEHIENSSPRLKDSEVIYEIQLINQKIHGREDSFEQLAHLLEYYPTFGCKIAEALEPLHDERSISLIKKHLEQEIERQSCEHSGNCIYFDSWASSPCSLFKILINFGLKSSSTLVALLKGLGTNNKISAAHALKMIAPSDSQTIRALIEALNDQTRCNVSRWQERERGQYFEKYTDWWGNPCTKPYPKYYSITCNIVAEKALEALWMIMRVRLSEISETDLELLSNLSNEQTSRIINILTNDADGEAHYLGLEWCGVESSKIRKAANEEIERRKNVT